MINYWKKKIIAASTVKYVDHCLDSAIKAAEKWVSQKHPMATFIYRKYFPTHKQ
jgi:hypothetical protein